LPGRSAFWPSEAVAGDGRALIARGRMSALTVDPKWLSCENRLCELGCRRRRSLASLRCSDLLEQGEEIGLAALFHKPST
jgi:hypothetical protein